MASASGSSPNPNESPSSPETGPAASNAETVYFCYKCQREVNNVGQDMTCPRCTLGFLEIVDRTTSASGVINEPRRSSTDSQLGSEELNRADFDQFLRQIALPMLQNLFPQPQAAGSQSTQPAAGTTGQASAQATVNPLAGLQQGQPMQGFFQNLLEGLTNGGVFQVQFQIDNNDGSGHPQHRFGFPMPLHGSLGDYAWGPGGLDAIVTQLLNQVEGGSPPMPKEKIDKLTDVTISKEQTEKRLQCAVCMDEFKVDEKVKQLACEHLFHKDCIKPWLERHNSCPVCRKSADTGEDAESHSPPAPSTPGPGGNAQSATGGGGSGGGGNRPPGGGGAGQFSWQDIEDLD